jgi:4,5-dihydroxyphthalate decarboxylase
VPLPILTAVTRTQGSNVALKQGVVKPRTFRFAFEEVEPLIAAFRRMVRGLEYDVCEMSITTYIVARGAGKRFTALPVFVVRGFHHGAIVSNTKAGIASPKDLEGKKVGINRGYTVTTGVWARAVLQTEYGVDLSRITWVLSGDEHVAEYRPPANVVPIEQGNTLAEMLIAGEIAAAIGVEVDHPDVAPLIPNAFDAGLHALRARGAYPINHLIVVKDELLEARDDLAPDIFDAFAAAKKLYLDRLAGGRIEKPTAADELHRRVMAIAGDPLPYGIEPNRAVLEELIGHAVSQGIIPRAVAVEGLFARNTLGLTG